MSTNKPHRPSSTIRLYCWVKYTHAAQIHMWNYVNSFIKKLVCRIIGMPTESWKNPSFSGVESAASDNFIDRVIAEINSSKVFFPIIFSHWQQSGIIDAIKINSPSFHSFLAPQNSIGCKSGTGMFADHWILFSPGTYQGQWLRGMRHGYGVRNSAPFGKASKYRANKTLRASLTSLRSNEGNTGANPEAVEKRDRRVDDSRGGFVLKMNSAEPTARRRSLGSSNIKKGLLMVSGVFERSRAKWRLWRGWSWKSNEAPAIWKREVVGDLAASDLLDHQPLGSALIRHNQAWPMLPYRPIPMPVS